MTAANNAIQLHNLGVEDGTRDHERADIRTTRTILGKRNAVYYSNRRCNDMLFPLGLLELGNATDFAANVWNGTPPPTISIVSMALGVATIPRTLRNSRLLRRERAGLRARPASCTKSNSTPAGGLSEHDLPTHIDVNTRELGKAYIDRLAMGLILGFGAFTVGIGTYLAIAGANKVTFLASNILTGYLGNIPAAMYGLANVAWCTYGWGRAESHNHATSTYFAMGRTSAYPRLVQQRESRVKTHALVNGVSGILGGIGSLMTATACIHPHAVWGYLILIPCVVSAVFANVMWRKRINYDRDLTGEPAALTEETLLLDTGYAILRERLVGKYCRAAGVYHWPPLSGRRRARRSAGMHERLHAFVVSFLRLRAEMLTYRNALFAQKISGMISSAPSTSATSLLRNLRDQTSTYLGITRGD